jgi:RNA polymerase sigma-70 factor (ECF subfamily)
MTHTISTSLIKIEHLDWMPERVDAANTDDSAISDSIDRFLKAVERRALRMAEMATSSRDDAMDLVQDAMFGFVRHYTDKPASDWAPLFYRVLDSRINDFHRRKQVRGRWLAAWVKPADDDDVDEIAQAPDTNDPGPLLRLAGNEASLALDAALKNLPTRQRQAFLLRVWEGFDVATTANVMRCSEGSVKTHLSRALAALRRALEKYE